MAVTKKKKSWQNIIVRKLIYAYTDVASDINPQSKHKHIMHDTYTYSPANKVTSSVAMQPARANSGIAVDLNKLCKRQQIISHNTLTKQSLRYAYPLM